MGTFLALWLAGFLPTLLVIAVWCEVDDMMTSFTAILLAAVWPATVFAVAGMTLVRLLDGGGR